MESPTLATLAISSRLSMNLPPASRPQPALRGAAGSLRHLRRNRADFCGHRECGGYYRGSGSGYCQSFQITACIPQMVQRRSDRSVSKGLLLCQWPRGIRRNAPKGILAGTKSIPLWSLGRGPEHSGLCVCEGGSGIPVLARRRYLYFLPWVGARECRPCVSGGN